MPRRPVNGVGSAGRLPRSDKFIARRLTPDRSEKKRCGICTNKVPSKISPASRGAPSVL